MVWCIWYPDGQAIWTLLCTSVIRHLAFHQTDNFSKTLRMQSTCLLLLSRTNFSNPNLNSNHQMLKKRSQICYWKKLYQQHQKDRSFWSRADGWCNDMCRYWILLASGTKQAQHYDGIKFKSWSLSHVAANLPPQAWLWSMGRMLSHASRGHSAFVVYV